MKGIDVSHHQGNIDWPTVKRDAGIGFVIMKAMFENGHTVESTFNRNYDGAAGLQRGAYLYTIATSIDAAQKEAVDFVRILNGRRLEYGVWLDLEDNRIKRLGKQGLTQVIDAQARIINDAGYRVGVYSNPSWYLNVIDGKELSKRYDMWIARYPLPDNGTIKPNKAPTAYNAKIWQYSSKGRIPGIKGNCDLDIEMTDLAVPVKETHNPYPIPTKNIKYGARGQDVFWLQTVLVGKGYPLEIDGIFGKNTLEAVKRFQKNNNLLVDGIVGVLTRNALLR